MPRVEIHRGGDAVILDSDDCDISDLVKLAKQILQDALPEQKGKLEGGTGFASEIQVWG